MITLTNTDTISIDVPSRRRWALLSTGQVGDATFTLPAGSAAASSAFINPDGGSQVSISDTDGAGIWNGIVTRLVHDERGVTVTASQPAIILSRIPVALNRTFSDVSVRHVVGEVFRYINAITGMYPIATGGIADAPILIPDYQMHGEDCWSVLQSMMQLSGQELQSRVSAYNDTLIWGNESASVADGLLLAPGQFRDAVYELDISEQAAMVTTLSDRDTYSVSASDIAANRWPAHLVVKSPQRSTLRALAESEIQRRLVPAIRVSGAVPREYWSLREGGYVRVLIPWARFAGATVLARIISREVESQGDVMQLELQTASGQLSTNRLMDDLRQVVRAESGGRRYLVGAS